MVVVLVGLQLLVRLLVLETMIAAAVAVDLFVLASVLDASSVLKVVEDLPSRRRRERRSRTSPALWIRMVKMDDRLHVARGYGNNIGRWTRGSFEIGTLLLLLPRTSSRSS